MDQENIEKKEDIITEKQDLQKEEEFKKKAREISIKEGSANGISEGFGSRYITPYALALGANNIYIGFLNSLPSLLGNFSKLYTIKVMWKTKRKKIAFLGSLSQAFTWLLIILVGFMFSVINLNSTMTHIFLILIYSILVVCGAFYGPAWNSWMKDIVTRESGRYFGRRNRIIGTVTLVSMLIAGFILDYFRNTKIFIGFAILFTLAFVSRAISSMFFLKKYEPEFKPEKEYYFSFLEFSKKMPYTNFGRFVIFTSLMQLATTIASPFFAVYMLKHLNFNYITYTIMIVSSSLVSLLFMPVWGKFADSYGNIKVIKICSFLISFIPLLWLASPLIIKYFPFILLPYLILVEVFSGFAWAGFNLSSSNFVYDAVTRQRMALCVSYYNIIEGIGVFIGATLIGGLITSRSFIFFSLNPILFVFLLSGIARLIVALIMNVKIKDVRQVKKFGIKEAKEKILALTPGKFLRDLDVKILKSKQV